MDLLDLKVTPVQPVPKVFKDLLDLRVTLDLLDLKATLVQPVPKVFKDLLGLRVTLDRPVRLFQAHIEIPGLSSSQQVVNKGSTVPLNSDGPSTSDITRSGNTITVNTSGVYFAWFAVNMAPGSSGGFALAINGTAVGEVVL